MMTSTHLIKMTKFPTKIPAHLQPSDIYYDKDSQRVFRYLGAKDPKTLDLLPVSKQWVDITHCFYNTNLLKEN